MALTLSGTNGVVGAGFTLDASGASVTAGVGTFGDSLIGGHAKGNNDSSKLSVFDSSSNIGIIQVHCGSEGNGDLAGIAFGQGGNTSTARAKSAIAVVDSGSYGRTDLCFYVDGTADNNPVSAADEKVRIDKSGRVGIGSTIPTTTLDVNGVISGDGSGLTAVNTPSFSAYVTGTPSISGNTNTTVVFDTEDHDTDGAYNNSTGVFTVPAGKAGKYHIDAYAGIDDIDDQTYVRIIVQKNGTAIPGFRSQHHCSVNQRIQTTGLSGTVTLAVGDEIRVQLFTNDGVSTGMQIESETCRFSMFRLSI